MPRTPYPPPQHPDGGATVSFTPKQITFLHPGYRRDAQPLLVLPACDKDDTIDHELARAACAIVACNAFEGFFTTDIYGQCRVFGPQLSVVEDGYFFHVPKHDSDNPYPICPSFRHWSPPPFAQLPSIWKQCEIPVAPESGGRLTSVVAHNIIKRDGTCRITNFTEQTEAAHILHEGESEWFHSRGMSRRAKIDDESNLLLLKIDVHRLWDRGHFTLAPRVIGEHNEKLVRLVTYVFRRRPLQEVVSLYHDVCLQPLSGIDIFFVFCRFAWTIFDSLDIFLEQGSARWLSITNPSTGLEEVSKYSPSSCRDKNFTRRGRSQSPKKNKRTASDTGRDGAVERACSQGSRSSTSSSWWGTSNGSTFDDSEQDSQRGRKRQRRQSAANKRNSLYAEDWCPNCVPKAQENVNIEDNLYISKLGGVR